MKRVKRVKWDSIIAQWPPVLRRRVLQQLAQPDPCLLCQQAARHVGVFRPCQPRVWGIPEGWQGGAVYTLCAGCRQLPDQPARVEALLWQARQRAVSARWN
jgi:hypothetical protein